MKVQHTMLPTEWKPIITANNNNVLCMQMPWRPDGRSVIFYTPPNTPVSGPHPSNCQCSTTPDLKFGHLILRKIIKFVATRCQISRLKCTKFNFGWESLQRREGEGVGWKERRGKKRRGVEGGKVRDPKRWYTLPCSKSWKIPRCRSI